MKIVFLLTFAILSLVAQIYAAKFKLKNQITPSKELENFKKSIPLYTKIILAPKSTRTTNFLVQRTVKCHYTVLTGDENSQKEIEKLKKEIKNFLKDDSNKDY